MPECSYPHVCLPICFLVYDIVSTKYLALSAFILYLIYETGAKQNQPQ